MDNGADWRGIIDVGSHQYDVMTYSGSYMDAVDNISLPTSPIITLLYVLLMGS